MNSSALQKQAQQAEGFSGQQNFMMVQNPSGGTTIFVNTDTYVVTSEPSTSLSMQSLSSDVSNQQP